MQDPDRLLKKNFVPQPKDYQGVTWFMPIPQAGPLRPTNLAQAFSIHTDGLPKTLSFIQFLSRLAPLGKFLLIPRLDSTPMTVY